MHAWLIPRFSFAGQPAWVPGWTLKVPLITRTDYHVIMMQPQDLSPWITSTFNPTHQTRMHTMEPQLLTTLNQYPFYF